MLFDDPKIQQMKPYKFFCCSVQTVLSGENIIQEKGKYFSRITELKLFNKT